MKTMIRLFALANLICFSNFTFALDQEKDRLEQVDKFINKSMKKYHVPAVSLAIIDHGKIIYTQAYSIDKQFIVTPETLFQSASVGKSVAALGALLLVDKGKINLNENVNSYLKSWKIPASPYTTHFPVTLRNILAMTSGLSVPGFAGQGLSDVLPTLRQILNGESPAENKPVQATFVPGTKYYYSGGSYEVLEQLLEDVSNKSFSDYMKNAVLSPLNMNHSQFIAILPKPLWKQAVSGFLNNGEMIKGRWKIIPALCAGGMWTTPTDLAKFTISIMHSFKGMPEGLISKKLAQTMLTRQKNTDFGLGFVIDGCGQTLNFRKEGHNIGFYNWLIAFPATKQGAIIMTNSENGMPLIKEVVQEISRLFKWPKHYPIVDESKPIPETC